MKCEFNTADEDEGKHFPDKFKNKRKMQNELTIEIFNNKKQQQQKNDKQKKRKHRMMEKLNKI